MKRLVLCMCAVVGFGCGGEDTETPVSVSKRIEAAHGGNIALEGEQTSIHIPQDALTEDTKITVSAVSIKGLPDLPSSRDRVLKIEPAGLTLKMPASVVFGLGGAIKEGETFRVHQLVDGSWKPMSAQLVSGNLVKIEITVLTTLALVVKEKQQASGGNQITATLTWSSGAPIANFPIELHQGESKLTEKNTDAEGVVTFVDLSAGEYMLKSGPGAECPVSGKAVVTNESPTDVSLVMCGN